MSVAAGTRIGHYEIIGLLGKGGMGEVYHAKDTRLGRKVALKVLSNDVTKNEDRVKRFQQEARSASALNHPNIITIYDVGELDTAHFIATELIEGETLRQRLKKGEMSLLTILDVAIQSATALSAAHQAGIMHRDIKPENIMLRADGYVKILDFGLAKLTESTDGSDSSLSDPEAETQSMLNTKPGTVMGTVSYMSPEQAQGIAIDSRTDIFSLGVVAYEMIAGRVPFEGATPSEVIVAILRKRPLPMARYAPDVPQELERIVSKALGKSLDERYQTMKDLLIDLRRLKQQMELEAEIELSGHADWSLPRVTTSSGSSGSRSSYGTGSGSQAMAVSRDSTNQTQEMVSTRSASSAEYLVGEIKRHKKIVLIVLGVMALVAVGALAYFNIKPQTIDSIAVLPFTSSNGDPNLKQVSDVITQRLINGLSSRMPNVRVKAFSSVARYSDKPADPQAVGRELEVQAVLTGNITKREGDDSVFVSVELVNAEDNSQIWGEQYDRKFADLRQVQEEILKGVFARVTPKISEAEKRRGEAEDLYQEGRNLMDKRTAKSVREAIGRFEQAIVKAPDYAPAYAGLADCYTVLVIYGAEAPKNAFPKAKEAAEKAVSLDDQLAEAHTALAFVRFRYEWSWDDADREFQKAVRLNSKYGQTYQWYANLLTATGRFDEAEQQTRRAKDIDPTSLIIQSHYGFIYYFARRYDDVIASCKKTLSLDPNFFAARRYLGLAYTQKSMYAEAIAEFQKALEASGNSPLIKAELGHALAASGNRAEAQEILDELIQLSSQRYISPYPIATIYAGLGDKEKAFEWINKAVEDRADFLVYAQVDPRLDPLRGDPRFNDLIEELSLR